MSLNNMEQQIRRTARWLVRLTAFHTYYVGEAGVWVHNTNCGKAEALQDASLQARFSKEIAVIEESCFYGETPVHIRINAHDTHLYEHIRSKEQIDRLGLIGRSTRAEIWHLCPGMEVLTRCELTGEIGYRKVTRVFEHESQEVYELVYSCEDEVFGSGNMLVTGNHPFWVINKGWVKVEDLEVDDVFLTSDGTHSHLISLTKEPYTNTVYNIEVEGFHTYFVGGLTGLWVHNKNAQVKARAVDITKAPEATALTGVFEGTGPEIAARDVLAKADMDSAVAPAQRDWVDNPSMTKYLNALGKAVRRTARWLVRLTALKISKRTN